MKLVLLFFALAQLHAIPWMFPETLLTKENPSTTVVSKIDSYGNAIAVWIAEGQREPQFSIYEVSTGAWRAPSTLDAAVAANPVVLPALCMSEEGRAIAFWVRGLEVVARVYAGGKWEPPIDQEPLIISSERVTGISEIYADMNRSGDGAVIWSETRIEPYRDVAAARKYVAGKWEPPLSESAYSLYDDHYTDTIDVFPSIKINEAGDLAAAWKFDGVIAARQFSAGEQKWIPDLAEIPFVLSGAKARFPRVAIDAKGDLYSAWVRDERIEVTKIVDHALQPIIALGVATHAPDLAVAPNGVAVVVWPSLGEMIFGSVLSKGFWSIPMMISQIGATHPSVGVDAFGNATVAWENRATGTVQMADLYRGVWQTPIDLFPIGNDPQRALVALSPSGNTLVSWKTNGGTGEIAVCLKNRIPSDPLDFPSWSGDLLPNITADGISSLTLASLGEPPPSPTAITGKKVRNHFGLVSEIFHEVRWEPSPSPHVVGYQVFVNNALVAQFPHTVTLFRDHNKASSDSIVYHVRAITAEGLQSNPLDIQPIEEEEPEPAPKHRKRRT